MRRWSIGLLLVAGCGTDGGPLPQEPADDEPRGAVTFALQDSLTGNPVAGALIRVDDREGTTDGGGMVTLMVHGGAQPFRASHAAFDPREGILFVPEVVGTVSLNLRPAAPFVRECLLTPSGIRAKVVDLAGRKTILRRNLSYLDMRRAAGTDRLPVVAWKWIVEDDLTYEVLITYVPSDLESIEWFVFDRDRNVRAQRCSPMPECQDCIR